MKIVSTFTNEPGVAQVRIQFWPHPGDTDMDNNPYDYDVATLNFYRWPKSATNHDECIHLGNNAKHRFCKPSEYAAKCQYSPTGYCRATDLLPGSDVDWSRAFDELRWRWKCDYPMQVELAIDAAGIYDLGVEGHIEMIHNIHRLNQAQLIPYQEEDK